MDGLVLKGARPQISKRFEHHAKDAKGSRAGIRNPFGMGKTQLKVKHSKIEGKNIMIIIPWKLLQMCVQFLAMKSTHTGLYYQLPRQLMGIRTMFSCKAGRRIGRQV